MKNFKLFLATAALATFASCQLINSFVGDRVPAGSIKAEGNYNLVLDVCNTYEDYLVADESLSETELASSMSKIDLFSGLFSQGGLVNATTATAFGAPVLDGHDSYVLADTSLSTFKAGVLLDNTTILRDSFSLALGTK